MRRNREAAAAAEDLRAAAERRLRLRRLGRAPGLPLPRFRTAALRLLQHADALMVRKRPGPPNAARPAPRAAPDAENCRHAKRVLGMATPPCMFVAV